MNGKLLPHGLWPSPLTAGRVARGIRLEDLCWDDDSRSLVWLERRSGRGVLVVDDGTGHAARDLTDELAVSAKVGYGGGDMSISHGAAYFAAGDRLYRQPLFSGEAKPITPAYGEIASPVVSPDGRWVLLVHSAEGMDSLGIVDTEGANWPQRLASGDDFYMQPAWHPDGRHVAWISWDHPLMPWDGTRLSLATLHVGGPGLPTIEHSETIAGDENTSIFQPAFSPDGRYLSYVSDESGWYGLYLHDLQNMAKRALVLEEAELGVPAWAQGMRTYSWAPDSGTIYYCRGSQGSSRLWQVCLATGDRTLVDALDAYSAVRQPTVSPRGEIAVIASSWSIPTRALVVSPSTQSCRVVARSTTETVSATVLREPEHLSWDAEDGSPVHGLFYRPRHTEATRPPLVVRVHGGPTSQSMVAYDPGIQFLVTRGYAVLELNYRGSSGYGRAYRNLLRGNWGLYDVDDAVSGARFLVGQGLVDQDKLVIMGGSAGGYTVLQALIRYPRTFKVGVCLYGVTDLFSLAADTHKFEQHYPDSLVGPLPEAADRYRERSPIFHVDSIVDPVAVFQGEEDRVVPPSQAEEIVRVLRQKGVPHEYHVYAGEGHGWRKVETVEMFYEHLLRFLRRYIVFA